MNLIKELVEEGFAAKRISEKINISKKEIKKIILNNSYLLKKENYEKFKINHICDLYIDGVSVHNLSKKYQISKVKVRGLLKRNGISLRNKSEASRTLFFNQNIFDEIDIPEKAYWLGFLYADGYNDSKHAKVTLVLAIKDTEHLKKYCKFLSFNYNDMTVRNDIKYPNAGVTLCSRNFSDKLTIAGCHQTKSFTIKYPEWLDDNLHSHFIRGMIDGDGCISSRHRKRRSTDWRLRLLSTKECCESIKNIIKKYINVDIKYHYISRTNNNLYEICVNGNEQVNKITDWLYENSTSEIRMDRKYEKYLELVKQQHNRKHNNIKYIPKI